MVDTAGVYFVPAFSGLLAPRWRSDARGVIVGLTSYSTKASAVTFAPGSHADKYDTIVAPQWGPKHSAVLDLCRRPLQYADAVLR